MLISIADYAKYPFTIEASEFVKQWDINISDFSGPYFSVLDRAEERIKEALIEGVVSWSDRPEYEVEILSYPTAILIVSAIKDSYLKRRYALSEARRAYLLLRNEDEDKIVKQILGIMISPFLSPIILNTLRNFMLKTGN